MPCAIARNLASALDRATTLCFLPLQVTRFLAKNVQYVVVDLRQVIKPILKNLDWSLGHVLIKEWPSIFLYTPNSFQTCHFQLYSQSMIHSQVYSQSLLHL